jgi:hypothetical protein
MLNDDQLRGLWLLPCRPGKCPECAAVHGPDQPHNGQSLHYQYQFRARYGRWPKWSDAIAHCGPDVRAAWEAELQKLGEWRD